MLIEFTINKILSKSSFIIVQTGISKSSVDVYELVCDFIPIKNKVSTVPFFLEIVISDIKLVNFAPTLYIFTF
jgi:hypothetical protein